MTRAEAILAVEDVGTPLGVLLLVADADGLVHAADFADCAARLRRLLDRRLGAGGYRLRSGTAGRAAGLLARYFGGDLDALGRVPVAPSGTPFQRQVWAALRALPAGTRRSYGELAHDLGRAGAPSSGRERKAFTRTSISAQSRLTWLIDIPPTPMAFTRSSTARVETP